MTVARIGIQGLAQFNRSLRKLDSEAPKQLRLALNEAANLLADKTRPKVPRESGAARASIRAGSTRTSARVTVGGRKAPYFPWLDFGGKTGRGRSAIRPFFKDGRYVFVTLGEVSPEIQDSLAKALSEVISNVGLEEN